MRLKEKQFEKWMLDLINTEQVEYIAIKNSIRSIFHDDELNFQLNELINVLECGHLYAGYIISFPFFENFVFKLWIALLCESPNKIKELGFTIKTNLSMEEKLTQFLFETDKDGIHSKHDLLKKIRDKKNKNERYEHTIKRAINSMTKQLDLDENVTKYLWNLLENRNVALHAIYHRITLQDFESMFNDGLEDHIKQCSFLSKVHIRSNFEDTVDYRLIYFIKEVRSTIYYLLDKYAMYKSK